MVTAVVEKDPVLTKEQEKEIQTTLAQVVYKWPLFLVEEGHLIIKTKAMSLELLKLNPTQIIILKKIKEKLKAGKPVRLWILKARQTGVSTLIEAIVYAFTSQRKGVNSCVIADDIDGSNYLFQMQKLFYEKVWHFLKPKLKHSNEKKLEFQKIHSQVLIDTADNPNAGRKFTFQFVHLSEVAFFPKGLKELMLGLNQSVPNLPGTMIIGETTANGIGGDFYDEWLRAIEGTSDWEAIFIPWFDSPEYSKPLEKNTLYPIEGIKFSTPLERKEFLKSELNLIDKHNLSQEQINWRRWCIVNNCGGSLLKFMQEYPDTWQSAFISTGDLYFDRQGLIMQKDEEPKAVGNIVKIDSRYEFREDGGGLFKIYEFPKDGGRYVVTGDTAEGLEHGDDSVWYVGDLASNDTVATYKHKTPPDQFAQDGVMLANYYKQALIAPENNGYGYSVCQDIYKQYGNIYRTVKTTKGVQEQTKELGFKTNTRSRPEMLAQLNEEIREEATALKDKDLIRQLWTFINIDGKAQAQKGQKDDMVISRAIFSLIRKMRPMASGVATSLRKAYNQRPLPNQGIGFKKEKVK